MMFQRYRYRYHKNIALHPYKAIYFYIPKVACSSLKIAYSGLLGVNPPDPENSTKYPHKRNFPYVRRDEIINYPDYVKFAFVRNPWDRIVSCYHNKVTDNKGVTSSRFYKGVPWEFKLRYGSAFFEHMSFTEFVERVCEISDEKSDDHFKSQSSFVTIHDELVVNYIGKLESFNEDVERLHAQLGIVGLNIPHLLSSDRKAYQGYYDDYTRNLVAKRYANDISNFHYEF